MNPPLSLHKSAKSGSVLLEPLSFVVQGNRARFRRAAAAYFRCALAYRFQINAVGGSVHAAFVVTLLFVGEKRAATILPSLAAFFDGFDRSSPRHHGDRRAKI
jgi:hypothetical protein